MNCQAGKPKTEGVTTQRAKEEKRSEVRKNACRLGVLGEVGDSSQVSEIALVWEETVCAKRKAEKGGLRYTGSPVL